MRIKAPSRWYVGSGRGSWNVFGNASNTERDALSLGGLNLFLTRIFYARNSSRKTHGICQDIIFMRLRDICPGVPCALMMIAACEIGNSLRKDWRARTGESSKIRKKRVKKSRDFGK
jgi:hypothetical protein